jgi:hypothetical protein
MSVRFGILYHKLPACELLRQPALRELGSYLVVIDYFLLPTSYLISKRDILHKYAADANPIELCCLLLTASCLLIFKRRCVGSELRRRWLRLAAQVKLKFNDDSLRNMLLQPVAGSFRLRTDGL